MFDLGTPKWEKSQTWWHTFQAGGSTCVFQSNQDDIHLIKKKSGERESSPAGNPPVATDSMTLSCPRTHHTHSNKATLMPTLISHIQ